MSDPKTLLQLAGADPQPAPLSSSALVIIDAQREYVDGKLQLSGIAEAMQALEKLLQRARASGAPVVHIRHVGRPGGLFDPDGAGGEIAGPVSPEGNERVIEKGLPNAFAKTALHEALQEIGRPSVTFAGFMTHMCVSSTARAALDLGYTTTVASDAAATRDLPDPMGGVIKADTLHRTALAELADRFAVVLPVADIPD